jgi:hypothetical protein
MEKVDFSTVGQRLTGADRRKLILELIEGR